MTDPREDRETNDIEGAAAFERARAERDDDPWNDVDLGEAYGGTWDVSGGTDEEGA